MIALPGPRDAFWGISIAQRMSRDILTFARESAAEFGDLAYFQVGPMRICLLHHPDLIHEALALNGKSMMKGQRAMKSLGALDGEAITVTEGPVWLRSRRLSQPAFHPSRFEGYGEIVANLTERMVESWSLSQKVDLAAEFRLLTLRTMTQIFFGHVISEKSSVLKAASREFLDVVTKELYRPFDLPDWLPLPSKLRKRRAIGQIRMFVESIIADRRASARDQSDLLSMLLLASDLQNSDKGLTDQQARDQAVGMFRAGQDAVSSMLTWTAAIIAQNPEIAQRVQTEVRQVLQGRRATWADVSKLTYTECVVKEALRLYPPAWMLFARKTIQAMELRSGSDGPYVIPSNTQLFVFPWSVQRDARFFADPALVKPKRFLPPEASRMNPHAYIPFGIGPHVCIGNTLSMMHATLTIAAMVQRVDWTLASESRELIANATIPLSPKHGLKVKCQRAGAHRTSLAERTTTSGSLG